MGVVELVIVFVGKNARASDDGLKAGFGAFGRVGTHEHPYRTEVPRLSGGFAHGLVTLLLGLVEYLIRISRGCSRSVRPLGTFVIDERIDEPIEGREQRLNDRKPKTGLRLSGVFALGNEVRGLFGALVPKTAPGLGNELQYRLVGVLEGSEPVRKGRKRIVFEVFERLYGIDVFVYLIDAGGTDRISPGLNVGIFRFLYGPDLGVGVVGGNLLGDEIRRVRIGHDVELELAFVENELEGDFHMVEYLVENPILERDVADFMDGLVENGHDAHFFLEVLLRFAFLVELGVGPGKRHPEVDEVFRLVNFIEEPREFQEEKKRDDDQKRVPYDGTGVFEHFPKRPAFFGLGVFIGRAGAGGSGYGGMGDGKKKSQNGRERF